MMKRIAFYILIIILICSCRKEDLSLTSNLPVFAFESVIKGEKVAAVAGLEGYYMYTDFDSIQDYQLELVGSLNDNKVATPDFRWRIKHNNLAASISDSVLKQRLEGLGTLPFGQSDLVSSGIRLIPQIAGEVDALKVKWQIGEDLISEELYPLIPYDLLLMGPVVVVAEFTIQDQIMIRIGGNVSLSEFCSSSIQLSKNLNTERIQLKVNHFNNSGAQVVWDNTETGNIVNKPIQSFDFAAEIDGGIDRCDYALSGSIFNTEFSNLKFGFVAQYPSANTLSEDIGLVPQDLTLIFELTDEVGDFYSSEFIKQDDDAVFNLLDVSPYEKNEKNLNTLKIDSRFSVKLIDESRTKVIKLQDALATFAVAVPE